jgi:hypothetical protein
MPATILAACSLAYWRCRGGARLSTFLVHAKPIKPRFGCRTLFLPWKRCISTWRALGYKTPHILDTLVAVLLFSFGYVPQTVFASDANCCRLKTNCTPAKYKPQFFKGQSQTKNLHHAAYRPMTAVAEIFMISFLDEPGWYLGG